jgi:hypothetical protein
VSISSSSKISVVDPKANVTFGMKPKKPKVSEQSAERKKPGTPPKKKKQEELKMEEKPAAPKKVQMAGSVQKQEESRRIGKFQQGQRD